VPRPDTARPDAGPVAGELTRVPFFPQERYQCGPAALATVLAAADVSVTADELVPRVYLPGRRGSLQTEMIAATRQYDRVPYVLDSTLDAIAAEIAAGRPVLVLQNLGLRSLPRWHYAVVVGVDAPRHALILRSGQRERLRMSRGRFEATWNRGDRWGLVALRPGELPAAPDPDRVAAAGAALEAVGRSQTARATFAALTRRWPDHAIAWFGLGNAEYRLGARVEAERAWRRVLALDPGHAGALNNVAQVLVDRGCGSEALGFLRRARAAPGAAAFEQAIAATEHAAAAQAPQPSSSCDAPPGPT
jgi:tetratricopeptide (TPR) repeat protein